MSPNHITMLYWKWVDGKRIGRNRCVMGKDAFFTFLCLLAILRQARVRLSRHHFTGHLFSLQDHRGPRQLTPKVFLSENCFVAALLLYKVVWSVSAVVRFVTKISSFNSLAVDFSCNGCEAAWWLLTCRLETRQPTGGFSSAAGGAGPLSATTLLSDPRDHRRPAIGTAAAATSSPPETCRGEAQSWAARASEESRSGNFRILLKFIWNPMFHCPLLGGPHLIWFAQESCIFRENVNILLSNQRTSLHDILDEWSIIAQKIIFSLYNIDQLINQ